MEQAQRVLPIILEKDALHRNFDDALFYGLMYYAEEDSYLEMKKKELSQ